MFALVTSKTNMCLHVNFKINSNFTNLVLYYTKTNLNEITGAKHAKTNKKLLSEG